MCIFTLVGEPLAFLNEDRLGSESHKVSFDDEGGVIWAEEEGWLAVWVDVLSAATVRLVHGAGK